MSAADRSRPTPLEFILAPELAALAIVDHAIDVALCALIAAQPPLGGDPPPYWVRDAHSRPIRLARTLCKRAAQFQRLLRAYHAAALAEARDHHDHDIPF
jgi:hypothetical protein